MSDFCLPRTRLAPILFLYYQDKIIFFFCITVFKLQIRQICLSACKPSWVWNYFYLSTLRGNFIFSAYFAWEDDIGLKQIQQGQFTLLQWESVSERQPLGLHACVSRIFPATICESERPVAVTPHASIPLFILGLISLYLSWEHQSALHCTSVSSTCLQAKCLTGEVEKWTIEWSNRYARRLLYWVHHLAR